MYDSNGYVEYGQQYDNNSDYKNVYSNEDIMIYDKKGRAHLKYSYDDGGNKYSKYSKRNRYKRNEDDEDIVATKTYTTRTHQKLRVNPSCKRFIGNLYACEHKLYRRAREWVSTIAEGKPNNMSNEAKHFYEDSYAKKKISSGDMQDGGYEECYADYNRQVTCWGEGYDRLKAKWYPEGNQYFCSHCREKQYKMYKWCPYCGETMENGTADNSQYLH